MADLVILIVAASLASGVLTAWIAKQKGLNPKLWFITGALSCGGALLLALLIRRRRTL